MFIVRAGVEYDCGTRDDKDLFIIEPIGKKALTPILVLLSLLVYTECIRARNLMMALPSFFFTMLKCVLSALYGYIVLYYHLIR